MDAKELPEGEWTTDYVDKELDKHNEAFMKQYKQAIHNSVIDGKINPKQFGFKKPIYRDFDIPDGEDDDRYLPRTNYLVNAYPTEGRVKKFEKPKSFWRFERRYRTTKLKAHIKPGSILIIVKGKHAGKRVVFLKQLSNGRLLVTGPKTLNDCPLFTILQMYVIGTSSKLDIKDVKLPEKITMAYFKQVKPRKQKKKDDIFEEAPQVSEELKKEHEDDQTDIDNQIMAAVKKHKEAAMMEKYLSTKYTVDEARPFHKLKF